MTTPKVTLLMPVYNDAKYISYAIESFLDQSYENTELIVVDNGSTDNTKDLVFDFVERTKKAIKYIYVETPGQLNALHEGSKAISGQYVSILHADDMLVEDSIRSVVKELEEDKRIDGVYADLIAIDKDNAEIKNIHVPSKFDENILKLLLLRKGSNPIPDIFFTRVGLFKRQIIQSYILWNIPYYIINRSGNLVVPRLKKIHPWYKYRIHGENYLRSPEGRYEVTNGRIRTILTLNEFFDLPFCSLQRTFITVINRVGLGDIFPVAVKNKKYPKSSLMYIKGTINDYYGRVGDEYSYLLDYFENFSPSKTLEFNLNLSDKQLLYGKDAKLFYLQLQKGEANPIYTEIMGIAKEMGFGYVKSSSKQQMITILKFLNIPAKVI